MQTPGTINEDRTVGGTRNQTSRAQRGNTPDRTALQRHRTEMERKRRTTATQCNDFELEGEFIILLIDSRSENYVNAVFID